MNDIESLKITLEELEERIRKLENHGHCENCGELCGSDEDYCSDECANEDFYTE